MATELILLQSIEKLGKIGDIVKVSPGYARNYLLPRGIAQVVTQNAIRKAASLKVIAEKVHAEAVTIAKTLAEKIATVQVALVMKASEEGKLFGSVSPRMIAELISKEVGTEIAGTAIIVEEAIRTTGEFTVKVHLMTDVETTAKVVVSAE